MAGADATPLGYFFWQFRAAQQIPQLLGPDAAPDITHPARIQREQVRQISDSGSADPAIEMAPIPGKSRKA
jgi:hypothetical protein